MTHRMLSGTTLFGEVMCKCNGNAARQNPLCHRCGERLSRPRQKPKVKDEIKAANTGTEKKEREAKEKSDIIASQGDIEVKSKAALNEENEKSKLASEGGCGDREIIPETAPKTDELQNATTELKVSGENIDKISEMEVEAAEKEKSDLSAKERKNMDNEQFKELRVEKGTTEGDKEETDILNNQKNTQDNRCLPSDSSHSEIKSETKKCRNRKKKSKDLRHQEGLDNGMYPEPVKIVQATKYLKPTSSEPKPEADEVKEVERNGLEGKVQFKSFVQGKKSPEAVVAGVLKSTTASYSSNFEDREFRLPAGNGIDRIGRRCEGNKENILENNYEVENASRMKSSFEFMKSWESMKKSDETYEKRAEILRLMRPEDLKRG